MEIPVVIAPQHAQHDPGVEVQCGRQIPAFDRTERMTSILKRIEGDPGLEMVDPRQHGTAPILRVHDPELVAFLAAAWASADHAADGPQIIFADTFLHHALGVPGQTLHMAPGAPGALGRFCFDTITGIGPGTWAAAVGSVDTALTAAERVRSGARVAVGLCRPPGHHVASDLFGGGCYLNNAAVATQWLRDSGAKTVAVLDLDFHHGNGTQAIFYSRADVLYASLHGDPDRCYPYFTGRAGETGTADGRGFTLNVPLPPHIEGAAYRTLLERALDAVSSYGPDFLVVSLGFDTYQGDPAGDAALTTADYRAIGADVAGLGIPMVALLEGGYSVDALGANLAAWINGVRDASEHG